MDVRASFAALTAEDGYALTYRVWAPVGPSAGVVVLFNGVVSHSGWFEPIAGALAGAGLTAVGADRRGTGENDRARGDAPSAGTLVADAKAIVERHRPADGPLWLLGWCWGAVLAINVAADTPADGLILAAPGLFPSQEIVDHARDADAAGADLAEDEAGLTPAIRDEMFTAGPALDGFIRRDPRRLAAVTPRFRRVMGRLATAAAGRLGRLELPVRVLLAERDRAVDNARTRTALGRLPADRVETLEVPAGHGLVFEAPALMGAAVVGWVLGAKRH